MTEEQFIRLARTTREEVSTKVFCNADPSVTQAMLKQLEELRLAFMRQDVNPELQMLSKSIRFFPCADGIDVVFIHRRSYQEFKPVWDRYRK